ncbi:MAG: AAA family ATPase [Deltaproteobacteria bacterium]|nr:AAA family ATPase [Deltaproteobacteria bacterium]
MNPIEALLRDFRDGGGLAGLAVVLGPEEAPIDVVGPTRGDLVEIDALAAGERTFFGRKLPLTGRRDALERLYNAVREACAERRAHVVSLVGPAGLGKSRIFAETLAIIGPAERGIDVLAVYADQADGPQALVGKLVRARFGIGPRDGDTAAYDRILEAVEPFSGERSLAATARLLGFLAGLRAMGPGADALPADLDAFRRQALKTLVQVFRKDLERAPRILVVKRATELHPHAVELLRDLVADLRDLPFVVVVMAESAPASLAPESVGAEVVAIEPLADRDIERLVTSLLDGVGVPDELVGALVARAHGSPRLVEENLLLLAQRGVIAGEGEALRFVGRETGGAIEDVVGPLAEDLETASRLRVDALSADERLLLGAAAVFAGGGRPFTTAGTLAVAQALDRGLVDRLGAAPEMVLPFATGELVLPCLEALDRAGVIARHGDLWRFRHGADRGRLIAEMSPPVRAQAHRVAAGWLRVGTGHATHETIAHHELDGARPAEAAAELLRASEAAQAEIALPRAKALLRKALHVLGLDEPNRGLDRAPLLLEILSAYLELSLRTGDHVPARALAWAALEAARVAGDPPRAAQAWLGLGRAYRGLGDYGKARTALGLASDVFRRINDSRGLGATLDQLARVHWLEGGEGGIDQALSLFEAALAIRRRVGTPRAIAETLGMIANIRIQHADLVGAAAALEEARTRWHEAGDLPGEARSLVALGAIAFAGGAREIAIERWREGLRSAELAGDRDLIGVFLNNIGEAHLELGDVPRAASALAEAREIASETGDLRTLADIVKNLAVLLAMAGDFDRADALVIETTSLAEVMQSRPAKAQAVRARATCRSLRAVGMAGDTRAAGWADEATRLYDEALSLFEALGDKWEADRTTAARAAHLQRRPG